MDRHRAYTELLKRHRATVWRLCLARSRGDMERCRDLMQEVCIALWMHFDQLRPDAEPHEERAWVCWQCRSTLDLLRRKEHISLQPLPDGAEETLRADNPADSMETVEELMSPLNADERQVVTMRLEGYNADEIAGIMGIGRNAVYQRVYRALAKMRSVALMLAALLAVSAVAVAVVPQWRQYIFNSNEPVDTTATVPAPIPMDTIIDNVASPAPQPKPTPRPRMEPMEHLNETAVETGTELPAVTDEPVVYIDGNKVVVSGVYGERVTIYSSNGNMLASQVCNGICVFTVLPDNNPFGDRLSYNIKVGDHSPIFVSSK